MERDARRMNTALHLRCRAVFMRRASRSIRCSRENPYPVTSLYVSYGISCRAINAEAVGLRVNDVGSIVQLLAVDQWFPPGTPVSPTRKLISSSSFHRLDMTLAVAEALNPNKPNHVGSIGLMLVTSTRMTR